MQPRDQTSLVATSTEIVHHEETSVRVVPVWASPPNMALLAMLGESRQNAPSAALRVIRHRLERRRADGMWTFGVTSARDGEGKSTLAAQLALVLSESQRARVVLIEASMQRPSLARLFGCNVPTGFGFSVQLSHRMRGGHAHPWEVMAVGPALHVLVENEAERGFPEALHSTHFRAAIEGLGRVYDWVVVDAPSVLGSGDANVVEDAVDGIVVVARSRASKGGDLRAAVKQLGDRKALGFVLWDAAGATAR
jgi:Mrp family chromosome partitioning ATPase